VAYDIEDDPLFLEYYRKVSAAVDRIGPWSVNPTDADNETSWIAEGLDRHPGILHFACLMELLRVTCDEPRTAGDPIAYLREHGPEHVANDLFTAIMESPWAANAAYQQDCRCQNCTEDLYPSLNRDASEITLALSERLDRLAEEGEQAHAHR
jgi:hypothetical protein